MQSWVISISKCDILMDTCAEPWRVSAAAAARDDNASPPVKHMSQQLQSQVWLEYAYRKHHPALQWLPTKLAEWIANNLQDELGFPDKEDPRRGWTPAELNRILQHHVVRNRDGCALTTFGSVDSVWNGSLSCTEVLCVPDATRGICPSTVFTK